MNVIDADLANIEDDWGQWPDWSHRTLVRRARHRWVAVGPFMKRWAILSGPLDRPGALTDVWLYGDSRTAMRAANEWTGIGEPIGWTAHPRSGRQRLRDAER